MEARMEATGGDNAQQADAEQLAEVVDLQARSGSSQQAAAGARLS